LALRRILSILVLGFVLSLVACQETTTQAATPATSTATPAPSVQAAASSDVYTTSGLVVVENQLDVAALREGVISRIVSDTGHVVHKGDLLAALDDRELSAQHEAAKAKVLSVSYDEKNWEAKVSMEEVDFDRTQKLLDAKVIPPQQLEHARFQLVAARNELEREREDLINAQDELRALDLELEKTQISAPFDGIVARRYVRTGQKVAVGDRLFWVTATGPLRVRFTLPQLYVGQIKTGNLVTVFGSDLGKSQCSARVIQVSPVIDPSSSTIDVLAQLQPPTGSLLPGMTVNVRIDNQR
jgi:RND family efflux transporter MFP subunit